MSTEKITIHFFCEGSTEEHYINKLLQQPFNICTEHPDYSIQQAVKADGTAPIEVLDEAIEKCDYNDFAHCWCIIDGDGEFETNKVYRQEFMDKWQPYRDRITVVFTNPAIELWFAWHLDDFSYQPNQRGNELKRYLHNSKEFAGYRSGRVNYPILYDKAGLNKAFKQSVNACINELDNSLLENVIPYSNFHYLIENFKSFFPYYPQEFSL